MLILKRRCDIIVIENKFEWMAVHSNLKKLFQIRWTDRNNQHHYSSSFYLDLSSFQNFPTSFQLTIPINILFNQRRAL